MPIINPPFRLSAGFNFTRPKRVDRTPQRGSLSWKQVSRPAIAPNVVADFRGTFQWNFPHTGNLTDMINLKPRLDASRAHDDKESFVFQCVPDSTKEY